MEEIVLGTHSGEHRCSLVSRVVSHGPSYMFDLHVVIVIPTQADPLLETHRSDESIDTEVFWLLLTSAAGGISAA